MKIAHSVMELIGNTPLVALSVLCADCKAQVVAKLERQNPGGSVKDRAAASMIERAEKDGLLAPGATLVEPTSGNTGVGLAMIAARKGYSLILTMPESMSMERRSLLAAYGARIVLTPAAAGMSGAVEEAERIAREIPGSFMPMQFENPANPDAHAVTAQEILRDTDGQVDVFVACVGTGGTITGVGRALKAVLPNVRIVAVEPMESRVLLGQPAGKHGIQGIGANFKPKNYDDGIVDEIIAVSTRESMETGRALATKEGLLCGISSGAAVCATMQVAGRKDCAGKRVVVLLPDTGERYLSTALFQKEE